MSDIAAPGAAPVEAVQRQEFDFRDPTRLTKVVSALLIAGAAFSVLEIVASATQFAILATHQRFDDEMWTGIHVLQDRVRFLLLLITAIPFLMWVYRANWNAHALGAADMKFRPGWAVGWYFIPFASLWMPFKVMRETWRVSVNPGDWWNAPSSPLVGWWWALYLIKNFLNGAASNFTRSTADASAADLRTAAVLAIPIALISAIASLVAWRLLRRIAANQNYQANIAQVF